jgi:hypothetical protein
MLSAPYRWQGRVVMHLIHLVCNVVMKTCGSAASVGAFQDSSLVRRYEGMNDLNSRKVEWIPNERYENLKQSNGRYSSRRARLGGHPVIFST